MGRKRRCRVVADFETTTDPNDLRVWASCAVDIDTLETVHLSNSMESFIEWLSGQNIIIYMHNLKFDIEFLLSYLHLNNYKRSTSKEPKTFDTLIADNGQVYSLTVIFDRKIDKKRKSHYKKAVFYDSLKKLPFKVSQIAKDFELPDQKLEIDYHEFRPIGHELTDLEKAYIVNDCRIVASALKIQFEQGLSRMTMASDAMNFFKNVITPKQFDRYFPTFPIELDRDIRRAYKGGYVYLKPEYKGVRGLEGCQLDINSLYPSIMYDRLLPIGYPVFFEGEPVDDPDFPLFIVRFECSFELRPGFLPTVQLKNTFRFNPTEYISSSDGDIIDMVMTSVDLKLFLEHYETKNLNYISGWRFRGVSGIFKDYIDHWMKIKEANTGAIRQIAKLALNSLYGRFALNPKAYKRVSYLDEEDIVRYAIIDTEEKAKEYGADPPEFRDPVYTAMGAFITAYAREKTIRSGQSVYDRFIYSDTDSLKLIGQDLPESLDIHPTRLGAWKDEGSFSDSKFIRAKTYMLTTEKGVSVTCAGMPDNLKETVTYDNFCVGSSFDGKLMPRRFKGGVILMPTTFTIM